MVLEWHDRIIGSTYYISDIETSTHIEDYHHVYVKGRCQLLYRVPGEYMLEDIRTASYAGKPILLYRFCVVQDKKLYKRMALASIDRFSAKLVTKSRKITKFKIGQVVRYLGQIPYYDTSGGIKKVVHISANRAWTKNYCIVYGLDGYMATIAKDIEALPSDALAIRGKK